MVFICSRQSVRLTRSVRLCEVVIPQSQGFRQTPTNQARDLSFKALRSRLDRDGWVTPAFVVLLVAAAVVWLAAGQRMTFFNVDDFNEFWTVKWSLNTLITPFNGHLIIPSRLLYHLVASIFGPEYWVLRVPGIAGVVVMDAVFFALMRRRVRPALALAATVPVLFLGSAWEAILWPSGELTEVYSIAAGLGALLALEEDGRRREQVACGLLILSLASFSIGVCFAAGVAVTVLLRSDRWRRAWIFAVPLALWGGWWLWSRHFGQSGVTLANLPHLPHYYWRSLSAVAASVTGLIGRGVPGVSFQTPPPRNLNRSSLLGLLTVAGIGFLVLRSRRSIPRTLWPIATTLLIYWTLAGLALGPGRGPEASRYMLPGALLVLLVAAEMARGITVGRRALLALYGAVTVMTVLNLIILRQAHRFFVEYSDNTRAQLAMLELAGARGQPNFVPGLSTPAASTPWLLISAGDYLRGVAHYGSGGDTLAQVEASPDGTRERADAILVAVLHLTALPGSAPPSAQGCIVAKGQRPSGPATVQLPRGGGLVRTTRASFLLLGRFGGTPTVPAALIRGGHWEQLSVPLDRATRPWVMTAAQAGTVDVCPLANEEAAGRVPHTGQGQLSHPAERRAASFVIQPGVIPA
jgi:hypothetical protein